MHISNINFRRVMTQPHHVRTLLIKFKRLTRFVLFPLHRGVRLTYRGALTYVLTTTAVPVCATWLKNQTFSSSTSIDTLNVSNNTHILIINLGSMNVVNFSGSNINTHLRIQKGLVQVNGPHVDITSLPRRSVWQCNTPCASLALLPGPRMPILRGRSYMLWRQTTKMFWDGGESYARNVSSAIVCFLLFILPSASVVDIAGQSRRHEGVVSHIAASCTYSL